VEFQQHDLSLLLSPEAPHGKVLGGDARVRIRIVAGRHQLLGGSTVPRRHAVYVHGYTPRKRCWMSGVARSSSGGPANGMRPCTMTERRWERVSATSRICSTRRIVVPRRLIWPRIS